jgi:hypothetical protein
MAHFQPRIERCKLEEQIKSKGLQPDVEIEFVKKPRPRALYKLKAA